MKKKGGGIGDAPIIDLTRDDDMMIMIQKLKQQI